MALLTRDQILAVDDRKYEEVPVPEWGGEVRVRSLSGKERDAFEASLSKTTKSGKREEDIENVRARFVALVLVDDKGTPLFSRQDVALLGNKSAAALTRVYDKGAELSRFTEKDAEELAEGFGKEATEDSTSA
jgi:hypothetical protein